MCKEIAPAGRKWGIYKGKFYCWEHPRVVKLKALVPGCWEVVRSFRHLEPFLQTQIDLATNEVKPVPITRTDGNNVEWVFVHTCKRTFLTERFGQIWGMWIRRGS